MPPEVLGFVQVEVDLDLGAVEAVTTTLDRQPRLRRRDTDAHGDVAVDRQVALAQRCSGAEHVGRWRLLGHPLALDLRSPSVVLSSALSR